MAGPVNVGAVLSSTEIVCANDTVLLLSSVAVQVLVMIPQPFITELFSEKSTIMFESQLSVAVTIGAFGIFPQSTVIFCVGNPLNIGATVSSTITVCVCVLVLPLPSSNFQVITCVPCVE